MTRDAEPRLDDSGVEQEALFEEPMMAALPNGHPLEGTTPSMAQLAESKNTVSPSPCWRVAKPVAKSP